MATFVTSDGVRLFYTRSGAGPRVYVCVGGPNADHRYLAEDLAPLERDFELVHHDYRGSGLSATAPDDTYTFDRLADDVDELRAHLGDESISIVGHSMGGFIAQAYALRHPDRCERLVFAGTYATTDPRVFVVPTLRALGWLRVFKMLVRAVWFLVAYSWKPASRERTIRMFSIWGVTQEGLPAMRPRKAEREARLDLPRDNDNVPAIQRLFRSLNYASRLSEIRGPVLVLYGDRDAASVATAPLYRERLPDVAIVSLPGIGHELFLESPAAHDAVRTFLKR